VKKLNKTVLLAAVLASAANANVNVSGDATIGFKYLTNTNTDANKDNLFVSEGNDENGNAHLVFSATQGGKSADGAYALISFDFATSGATTLPIDQAYVGYKAKKFDIRMGQLDSLTYTWVGSANEHMYYADNISVVPARDQQLADSVRATTKLGSVTLGAFAQLPGSVSYDYAVYDLGAKFDIGKFGLAVTHQEANDAISTNSYEHRDTTSAGLNYALKNLSSAKLLKGLELSATYASYSEQTTANSGRQSEDSSYSIGLKMNNTSVLYQTGINYDQDQWNIQHLRPLSANTDFGITGQISSKYYASASGSTNSNETQGDEFVAVFMTTRF